MLGLIRRLPGPVNALLGLALFGAISYYGGALLACILGSPGDGSRWAASEAAQSASDASSLPISPKEAIAPEAFFGVNDNEAVYGNRYMAVAAHPAASQAAATVIEDGGTAIDALIAAQMVLNLVEPQSSGIGGGGFLLYWDAARQELFTYDGRETAPMAADGGLFRNPDGSAKSFWEAVVGGRSVGVPGLLKMLAMAHDTHGAVDWATLFEPAIGLAEKGFPVSARLASLLADDPIPEDMDVARDYFYDDGAPLKPGDVLENPELAETFREIASDGVTAFYEGEIAEDIVATVQDAPRNPGVLTLEDMAAYRAIRRDNLCMPYRQYTVCGMPPPSSGGLTVLQTLALLERYDIGALDANNVLSIRLVSEAMKLAYADRDRYIADPDFVAVPTEGMLDETYIEKRSRFMDLTFALKSAMPPGRPPQGDGASLPIIGDTALEVPSTTHITIVDEAGNVASMTSSIEMGFGSRLMVRGFLLNNQLTDFSTSQRDRDGKPTANRLEPGKRPRSSMAPTIVLGYDGTPTHAIGSPGGSRIIGYVTQSLIGMLDWGLSVQEAVDLPHYLNRNGPIEMETDSRLIVLAGELQKAGYKLKMRPMASGLHGVHIIGNFMVGGADPRREGKAISERNRDTDLQNAFEGLYPKDMDVDDD